MLGITQLFCCSRFGQDTFSPLLSAQRNKEIAPSLRYLSSTFHILYIFIRGYRAGNQEGEITGLWGCRRWHVSPGWYLVANGALDTRLFHQQTEASPPGNWEHLPAYALAKSCSTVLTRASTSVTLRPCVLSQVGLQTRSGYRNGKMHCFLCWVIGSMGT